MGRGSQSVTPALFCVASFESVSFKFGDRLLKLQYSICCNEKT